MHLIYKYKNKITLINHMNFNNLFKYYIKICKFFNKYYCNKNIQLLKYF